MSSAKRPSRRALSLVSRACPSARPVELEVILEVRGECHVLSANQLVGCSAVLVLSGTVLAQSKEPAMAQRTAYRSVKIDGLTIFYRVAGPKDGAPCCSCCTGFLVVADVRTFAFAAGGAVTSDCPRLSGLRAQHGRPKEFSYTFDNLATVMNHFTETLNLPRYTLYMQDYGGPVGFRMALAHPDRVEALIVQDAVAHNDGLGANWKTRRPSGRTAPHTRPRCGPTCSRWQRREHGTSAMTRIPRNTIPICGPTSTRS